jgi:threonine dehydrogenase-like Zn-dependent dehydrogenase
MMAFYSFSFMGAGPIGAVVMTVALRSPLWSLDTSPEKLAAARSGVS